MRKPKLREGKKVPQGQQSQMKTGSMGLHSTRTQPWAGQAPQPAPSLWQVWTCQLSSKSQAEWWRMATWASQLDGPTQAWWPTRRQMPWPACHESLFQLHVTLTQTPLLVPYICWCWPKDILKDSSRCQKGAGFQAEVQENAPSRVLCTALPPGPDKSGLSP